MICPRLDSRFLALWNGSPKVKDSKSGSRCVFVVDDKYEGKWTLNLWTTLLNSSYVGHLLMCVCFTGMLLVVDGQSLISVKSSIREYPKKRFTVAHEMGHFSIPEHITKERYFFQCTDKDLNNFDKKGGKEAEANEFAAELLMPEEMFKEK